MRGKNLCKIFRAVDLLGRPQGTTVDELSDELGIDRRSVYRLCDTIQELGFPIYDEKIPFEKKKRWKLESSYLKKLPNIKLPDINLTLSEVISLYFLKGEERIYKGTDIGERIDSAFTKIGMFAPNGLADRLDKVKALFIPISKFAKDYSKKGKMIELLTDAMLQRKTCAVEYHSFSDDRIKKFKIDPLRFFENNGGLYMFARITRFGDIRLLAVERILSLELTDDNFEYPKNFIPEDMLDSAFDIVYDDPIHVKIWFSPEQARYIKERQWAKNQKIKEQKDGSIILEMKTSGFWDVKKWALSFGAEAKVLKPKELRQAIIKEFTNAMKCYK